MRTVLVLVLALVASGPALGDETRNGAAREFLSRIRGAPELQAFLDGFIAEALRSDPALARVRLRAAVLDLTDPEAPGLASHEGQTPIYPASVVKFVYLIAAYAFQEQGRLRIDPSLDRELGEMIRVSSNRATQRVFERLTDATPGPALSAAEYAAFRERRLAVERWLQGLGIDDLHTVNPTYDGGDISGREDQFLRDPGVPGALPGFGTDFKNRTGMTADGTVELLALLARGLVLSPSDTERVRERMKRDSAAQRHLAARIAGGAERVGGLEVHAKSGTWGPIYADAGLVRAPSEREFAIAVYTEGRPPYRGDFIADLTEALARRLLAPGAESRSRPSVDPDPR